MDILEVIEIGLEVGIEVLKGEKTILEGIETIYERTSKED